MLSLSHAALPLCQPAAAPPQPELWRYCARLGVTDRFALERLVERLSKKIAPIDAAEPLRASNQALVAWLEQALGEALVKSADGAATESALAIVVLSGSGQRWPDYLLAEGPLPIELVDALRAALPHPVPPQQPLFMPRQSLAPAGPAVRGLPAWGLPVRQQI